jgi:hypothetical protein
MAAKRGLRYLFVRDSISLEPPPPERMELEITSNPRTISSFIHSRASELSWAALNRRMAEPGGAVFWIGGPAGCGKTHFLNYVLGLAAKAGSLESQELRHVTCGFELIGRTLATEMETNVLDVLAEAFGGTRAQASLWQGVRGGSAMMVALEQARRIGIRAVTLAIDFGLTEVEPAASYFNTLAEVAASCKLVRLNVVAAGRAAPPPGAQPLLVAPQDAAEAVTIALARVREITPRAEAPIAEAYEGVALGKYSPHEIFPFHPAALNTVIALADASGLIASAARLLREVLAGELEDYGFGIERLTYPCDLMDNVIVARRADAILGETGTAAAQAAREAALKMDGNERKLARQIADTLISAQLAAPGAALAVGELTGRVPMLAEGTGAWTESAIAEIVRRLAAQSSGAIELAAGAARFNPSAASAPEVARFNTALPLVRRFIPDLTAVRGGDDLRPVLRRLSDAMANAIEYASRTRETLAASMAEAHLQVPPAHLRAIAEFVALAEGGPDALMDLAASPAHRESAVQKIAAYEGLAAAAGVLPRMRAMRNYLQATGLRISFDDDPARDSRVTLLETECQLLAAEIGPRALDRPPRNLDAVEARFQKFRWTYVQLYRNAHAGWRSEMERVARAMDDARRNLDALARLNSMAALGPPVAEELAPRFGDLANRIRRCDFEGTLAVEEDPRCPRCGYVLGEQSPRTQLEELAEQLRRALDLKLGALSNSAIARLIREHDHARRLEGFLKIIQAAQTEALVRVLDDRLAHYLARLLDENLAPRGSDVVETLESRRSRTRELHPPRRK